jgi:putative phosphoribosyl transferase
MTSHPPRQPSIVFRRPRVPGPGYLGVVNAGGPRQARFRNRREAGKTLAARLGEAPFTDAVVLALPRGGVPVAYEVAVALHAPLDVFVARKVGAPGHEELGIGAIAEGSDVLIVTESAHALGLTSAELVALAERERIELRRRVADYRGDAKLGDLKGRDVILVDDGVATGVTAEAALRALRLRDPRRLVLAVPVCAPDTARRLATIAEQVVCLAAPTDFFAVGAWYDFSPTSDTEVLELLRAAHGR